MCGQGYSKVYTSDACGVRRTLRKPRRGRKGRRQRRVKGNPNDSRGIDITTPASSLHLRDARNDRSRQPLLYGLRVYRWRSNARLYHQPRSASGAGGTKVCASNRECIGILSSQFDRASRPQNRKHSHFQSRELQNHRLWAVQPILAVRPSINILRLVVLCRAGTTQRQGLYRSRSGCVEFWNRFIRSRMRQSAV